MPALREMAMSAIALPDKANRFLDRANRGEMDLQIEGIREGALLLYAGVHQAIFAFLLSRRRALSYALGDAWRCTWFAILAGVGAGSCLLAVVVSIVRVVHARSAATVVSAPERD